MPVVFDVRATQRFAVVGEDGVPLPPVSYAFYLDDEPPCLETVVIKEAMAMLGKPGGGRVRPPLSRLASADREHLRELLPSLGVAAIT